MPHILSQRGSSLVATTVVILTLTLIATGLVSRTSIEMESANAKVHYDQSVECAEGARALLMSRFRATGLDMTTISFNQVVGNRRYATGHYDNFGLLTVAAVAGGAGAGSESAVNIANSGTTAHLGGAIYRVVVVCSDSTSNDRQSEIEFLIRFGL